TLTNTKMDSQNISEFEQCVVAHELRRRRQEELERQLKKAIEQSLLEEREQQPHPPKRKRDEQERVENPRPSKRLNGQEPQPQPQPQQQQQQQQRKPKRKRDGNDEDEQGRCAKRRRTDSQQADEATEEQGSNMAELLQEWILANTHAGMSDALAHVGSTEVEIGQQTEEEQDEQESFVDQQMHDWMGGLLAQLSDDSLLVEQGSHAEWQEGIQHAEEVVEGSQWSNMAQLVQEMFPDDIL
ncbi:hypothetical protein BGX27_003014, partial [Mortierella sp. AM989]